MFRVVVLVSPRNGSIINTRRRPLTSGYRRRMDTPHQVMSCDHSDPPPLPLPPPPPAEGGRFVPLRDLAALPLVKIDFFVFGLKRPKKT